MLRRPVTSILVLIIVLLIAFPSICSAGEGWKLWMDGRSLGVVPVATRSSETFVAIGKMASLLKFDLKPKDDTLIISSGRDRIQVVKDAAAVWHNVQLVPLAAPAVFDDGRWWLDSRSAIKIMQLILNSADKGHSIAWAGSGDTEPVTVPRNSKPSTPRDLKSPQKAPSVSLRDLRWGKYDDKVRLVLDLGPGGVPEVKEGKGKLEIPFAFSSSFNPSRISSPYPSLVRATVTNYGSSFTLKLAYSSCRVDRFTLTGPSRLVVDFYYGSGRPVKEVPVQREDSSMSSWKSLKEENSVPPKGPSVSDTSRSRLVVIDPGHGGKDPGAVANGIREKDVNLQIAKRLASHLKKMGIPARLTRTDDRYLKLQQRTRLANEWNAAMFVSIHANALPPGRHATGMEIYLMALPTDKDAMQLALIENKELTNGGGSEASARASDKKTKMLLNILGNMQQNAKIGESTSVAEVLFNQGKRKGLPMRRVAQAPFYVLRGAGMPAVLIETGFLTEKKEARLLASSNYQEKLAGSLAEGISSYLAHM